MPGSRTALARLPAAICRGWRWKRARRANSPRTAISWCAVSDRRQSSADPCCPRWRSRRGSMPRSAARGCERAMSDFWLSCGHHLLDRDRNGRLGVTDEFMKLYLARPEVVPPPGACVIERSLQAALLRDPWRAVAADEIDAMAEADARENWRYLIALRD